MPNKKKKPNGIQIFIDEVLRPEKFAATGVMYSTQRLFQEGHDRFADLPKEEQKYYTSLAKERISAAQNVTEIFFPVKKEEPPKPCVAFNLDDDKVEREERERILRNRIRAYSNTEALKKENFVFVGLQSFVEHGPPFRPIEIALVKWNMNEGVLEDFTNFINPGEIPIGLRYDVKRHAERTHAFSDDKYSGGTSDYIGLWTTIRSFIAEKGSSLKPVYCLHKDCHLVSECLKWINTEACIPMEKVEVDPIEYLFKELFSFVGVDVDLSFLDQSLTSICFESPSTMNCFFHIGIACEHCALGYCKKSMYTVLSDLSAVYGFTRTENHVPRAGRTLVAKTDLNQAGWFSGGQSPKYCGQDEDLDWEDREQKTCFVSTRDNKTNKFCKVEGLSGDAYSSGSDVWNQSGYVHPSSDAATTSHLSVSTVDFPALQPNFSTKQPKTGKGRANIYLVVKEGHQKAAAGRGRGLLRFNPDD